MKILVVTNDFPPKVGGANAYVGEIVRRLPRGSVVVFASSWPGDAEHDRTFPHPVVRWPVRTLLPTPRVEREVFALIRAHRIDALLFGASFPLARLGVRARRQLSVPYATFTHGLELAVARLAPGRRFLRRVGQTASLVTTVSQFAHARLEPLLGERPLELLYNGVDGDAFRPDVSADRVRERHALGGGPIVCCVSRLVARKGQDHVIGALPGLAADWPGIRFLIVGAGSHRGALVRLAASNRMSESVVFAGEVGDADLPAYFRAGDVFAMPCRSRFFGFETEAFGAVYLQAAAVGRPCIGGRAGGAPEAVRDGETGLVVDGTSTDAVEQALRRLLSDPERAREMGRAGAEWVHRELTWDRVAARLESLLASRFAQPA